MRNARRKVYAKICAECGEPFEAKRQNAFICKKSRCKEASAGRKRAKK
jgi:hypothetical protein